MHFPLSFTLIACALVWAANGARLPVERSHISAEHLVPRDALYIGEYPVFMKRRHYDLLDALERRASNAPTTGNSPSALGAQKLQTTSGNGAGKTVMGGNQPFGQQKKVQNTTPDYANPQKMMPQQVGTKPTNNTKGIPGADYYNKQTPAVQKQLIDSCDTSVHADNTHQEELLFRNSQYDHQTDQQVADTLSKQCYTFQDKTLPQYSNKVCGDFNNDKLMPKCSGEFFGGRIPGTSAQTVYTASCEINKVSSPKYFGSISDNERNKLITNVDGDHGKLTAQFLDSLNSTPYKGSANFCKNVP